MLLKRRQFFVKEQVAFMKFNDTYDILDPETGQPLGVAREEPTGWSKYARFFMKKLYLPTTVNVYENGDDGLPPLLTLHKSPGLFRQKVTVTNAQGATLGLLVSKFVSFTLSGGGFSVLDAGGTPVAEVKGDWKGWNFRLLDTGGRELGVVTKKWSGLGRELFTSADNYMISLADDSAGQANDVALMLAAALAIDIVFKEAK
jgi:hypothetical protein